MVSPAARETKGTRATTSPGTHSSFTAMPPNEPAPSEPWSVEQALAALHIPPPSTPSTSPLSFFHFLERLKTTKREGWCRFEIHHGESISDHMYRMSILTMLAPPSLSSRLNIPHCTKMALVHDMAECLVGDITPMDKVPKEEKHRREATTMDYLTGSLLGAVDGGVQGRGMREVWQEYEDNQTLEAKFVHDVDKMELMLQMVEYEKTKKGKLDLGEFLNVAQGIKLEEMKGWCREVLRERQDFWRGLGIRPDNSDLAERLLS